MKRLLLLYGLLVATAFGQTLKDTKIPQLSKVSPPTWSDVVISPVANSLLGFGSDKTVGNVTIGSGLTLSSGVLVATGGGGGSGTVTSFSAGDLSPLFTSSVATATTTPALTFTLSNQIANRIYAGPATGSTAAPTFRPLVTADLPSGTGDAVGPSSATDNALVRFDSTTGKLIQNSTVTLSDTTGVMAGLNSITAESATTLTLSGGSSGATVVLGQGTNAGAVVTLKGAGGVTLIKGSPAAYPSTSMFLVQTPSGSNPPIFVRDTTGGVSAGLRILQLPSTNGGVSAIGDGMGYIMQATNDAAAIVTYGSIEFVIADNTAANSRGFGTMWLQHNGQDHVPYFYFRSQGTSTLTGQLLAPGGKELGLGANDTETIHLSPTAIVATIPIGGTQLTSSVATGTPPLVVTSATQVANLNAATAGSATTATTATNATNTAITDDTTTNATMYPTWVTAATGNLPQKVSSTKLSFNPSTGLLASTGLSGTSILINGPAYSDGFSTHPSVFRQGSAVSDPAVQVTDGGSGVGRGLYIYAGAAGSNSSIPWATFDRAGGSLWLVKTRGDLKSQSTRIASSGVEYGIEIAQTYNQTSTAGSADIRIDRTETAVGSGVQNFLSFTVNAGSDLFAVSNAGKITTLSTLELGNASDTTIARVSAGVAAVEGNTIFTTATKADVLEASIFAADAGSTDTYAITLSPAITAYVTGAHYWFKANTANTGAATININSVGAKTIVKVAGGITTALADNDIRSGQWVDLVYDGTNMQMQSLLGNAPAGGATLTSTYVGYGDGSNALTGEAAFTYTAASNTATIGAVSLGAGGETSSIGNLVDAVDGTTPLNNIIQTVASGTAYTMTTSYAALDFGTTDPVLTIANAGTYAIYVQVQTSLVSATTTTQSVTFKLRRTNNTAADLAGSTFGQPLPVATIGTEGGPSVSIGPIKYTTGNTNDSITVQGLISASLGAGTVTASDCTITAVRMY